MRRRASSMPVISHGAGSCWTSSRFLSSRASLSRSRSSMPMRTRQRTKRSFVRLIPSQQHQFRVYEGKRRAPTCLDGRMVFVQERVVAFQQVIFERIQAPQRLLVQLLAFVRGSGSVEELLPGSRATLIFAINISFRVTDKISLTRTRARS